MENDILSEKEKQKSFCIIQTNRGNGASFIISQELSSCEFSEDSGLVHFFCGDTRETLSVSISIHALRKITERLAGYSKNQTKFNYVDTNTDLIS